MAKTSREWTVGGCPECPFEHTEPAGRRCVLVPKADDRRRAAYDHARGLTGNAVEPPHWRALDGAPVVVALGRQP